jgi:cytochrome P450
MDQLKTLINERKATHTQNENPDFIDFFLDAESEDTNLLQISQSTKLEILPYFQNKLSTEEIIANCKFFSIAGSDTVSNALALVIYYLAKYEEIQDKLRNEIGNEVNNNNNIFNHIKFSK